MTEKFIIKGGKKLEGEIEINGAKNAALKIFAASLLTDQEWQIENVPQVKDVFDEIELLRDLGAEIEKIDERIYKVKARDIKNTKLREDLAQKIRASIVLVGPILARKGEVEFIYPGGCVIGRRPIDIFLDGFKALGAEVAETNGRFKLTTSGLRGNNFVFPRVSVTGTEALILTAVLAKGKTIFKNTAQEPEIKALVDFLNKCGAKIKGAGTSTIEIEGVNKLEKGTFKLIPDRIEAGTFAILAAATGSHIKINNCNPQHLESLWLHLKKTGANFELGENFVEVKPTLKLKTVNVTTHEYPGFATDLQPPFTVLMTQAEGRSLIHETLFESRLFYTDTLNQMGGDIIMCDPHRVIVNGPTRLHGKTITSPDLRAGIALVIAALVAQGTTTIENIEQIDRGYEKIEERLQKIGADIKRVSN